MNFAILGGLTLKELVLKTWSAIGKHNCLGRAAELAFYFTLALFPLRIVLLNVISFMPGVQETILFWLSRLMPPDATRIVETWVQNVFANRSGREKISPKETRPTAADGMRGHPQANRHKIL